MKTQIQELIKDLEACKVGNKKSLSAVTNLTGEDYEMAYNSGLSDAIMKIKMHLDIS